MIEGMTFWDWLLGLLGLGLLVLELIVWSSSNFHVGHLLTVLLALAMMAFTLLRGPILAHTPRFLLWTAGVLLFSALGFMAFLYAYGKTDTCDGTEDAVIVLGAGLRGEDVSLTLARRLDVAVAYHRRNPRALIVVSGGQGANEQIPEALAMRRYLTERGVPEELILMEDRSTDTSENFAFSKAMLEERLGRDFRTVVVTTDFHAFRAEILARHAGLAVTRASSPLSWYQVPANYLREMVAMIKLLFIDLR